MKLRTAVMLVDGSNIYATAKALGFQMNYKSVIDSWEGEVLKAFYFTALIEEQENFVKPLVDWLTYNGWTTITKAASEWMDPVTQKKKVKGNMDIEIATIAFEMALTGCVTDIVLFTGDGDFRFLVEALQRRFGIRITIVSSIRTRPPMCADVLRRQADAFIDIADWRGELERKQED